MPARRAAPPARPISLELRYWRRIRRQFVLPMARLIDQRLRPLLVAYASSQRTDAEPARSQAELETTLHGIRIEYAQDVAIGQLSLDLATEAEKASAAFNAAQQAKMRRQLHAINVFNTEPQLRAVRAEFLQENVQLIKSIPEQHLGKVAEAVREAFDSGTRAETLRKRIQEIHDITDRRARLIARDQISKHNGALARVRQRGAGFTHYQWSTARDERVRPTHMALEGEVFSWNEAPPPGHPGEDYQCRCAAVPVMGEDLPPDAA